MSEQVSKKDRFIAHFMKQPKADLSSVHQAIREEALQALTQLEFPTLRDEHWKYTRVAGILKEEYDIQETKLDALPEGIDIEGETTNLLVFANGFFQPHLSTIPDQDGIVVLTTDQARVEEYDQIDAFYGKHANHKSEIFTALNTAFNHTGAFIRIAKNAVLDHPIQLVDITVGERATFQPRNLIIAEQGAKATILHRFVSVNAGTSFINGVSEVIVGENAQLSYWMLEQHSSKEQHIQTTEVYQERNSLFKTGTFTFGGKLVRNNLNIAVDGEGCETHLNGVSLTDANMHVDHHTVVDHLKPHCESNENYKGVLSGKSTGVFNGKVFVRPDAQKINAFQNNQNILLSDDATINSKPELEIYADDVKCSHGSTTGELDEEGLFYLQSRGVNPIEAKKMMINAFADEALAVIDSEAIRHHIEQIIAERCEEL